MLIGKLWVVSGREQAVEGRGLDARECRSMLPQAPMVASKIVESDCELWPEDNFTGARGRGGLGLPLNEPTFHNSLLNLSKRQ